MPGSTMRAVMGWPQAMARPFRMMSLRLIHFWIGLFLSRYEFNSLPLVALPTTIFSSRQRQRWRVRRSMRIAVARLSING